MKNKKKFYLLLGGQICIVGFIIFLFSSDFSIINFFKDKEYIFSSQNQACDLHKTDCTIQLNQRQSITFSISPKSIPLMKKITFKAVTKNIESENLTLSIYATNMNMGIHNFTLNKKTDGLYEGSGILPTCIIGGMNWNADITSKSFLDNSAARFYFKTTK